MTWQAIAAGANGIFYWEFNDLFRNPDVGFNASFEYYNRTATEVLQFAPLLLSGHGKAPPPAVGAARAWLVTRTQWADRAHRSCVLFAVSDGRGGGAVTLDLSQLCATAAASSIAVVRIMEAAPNASTAAPPPRVSGCSFTDSVPSLAATAYNISLQPRRALKTEPDAFRVFWNSPFSACQACADPGSRLGPATLKEFGITANPGLSFVGSQIAMLYGPGLWPTLSGDYTRRTPCWVAEAVPGNCTWAPRRGRRRRLRRNRRGKS